MLQTYIEERTKVISHVLENVLSLCERTQNILNSGRVQSHLSPNIGDVVLLKEMFHVTAGNLGKW